MDNKENMENKRVFHPYKTGSFESRKFSNYPFSWGIN